MLVSAPSWQKVSDMKLSFLLNETQELEVGYSLSLDLFRESADAVVVGSALSWFYFVVIGFCFIRAASS